MRFEYTPGLTRALTRAMAWAGLQEAPEVLPLHFLQGLVEDEDGQPNLLLESAGIPRAKLTGTYLRDQPSAQVETQIPLAQQIREILSHAQHLARSLSPEATLASDHALLALLEMEQDLRQDLEELGLNFPQLQHTINPPRPPIPVDLGEPLNLLEPPEDIDAARILDASINRSREGLRVLEDYARFVLNDPLLSGGLKDLRHELASTLKEFPERLLLEARDTQHDVGTDLSTPQERERSSLTEVVQANARRAQEALRSLEEFSKIFSPELGQAFEKIRYQTYTLERALLLGSFARDRLTNARLYVLVTEEQCRVSLLGTVSEAIAGGAQVIQLREKGLHDRDLLKLARTVRKMTRDANVLFIVNDRPDIARLAEADGVHLGQEDMPLQEARRIVGHQALIGVSTHNLDQVRQAVLGGAGYIGVGPTFPSQTKTFADFPGLDFVRQVVAETTLPAFVLGGVTLENVHEVVAAGARRIAISHAVCAAVDPRQTAAQMRAILDV